MEKSKTQDELIFDHCIHPDTMLLQHDMLVIIVLNSSLVTALSDATRIVQDIENKNYRVDYLRCDPGIDDSGSYYTVTIYYRK